MFPPPPIKYHVPPTKRQEKMVNHLSTTTTTTRNNNNNGKKKNPIDRHVHSLFMQSQLSDVMIGVLPSPQQDHYSFDRMPPSAYRKNMIEREGFFEYPAHKIVLIQAFRLRKYILQHESLSFIHLHDVFSVYDPIGSTVLPLFQDKCLDGDHHDDHHNEDTHKYEHVLMTLLSPTLPHEIQEDCFRSALSLLYGQDLPLFDLTQEYALQVFDLLMRMGAFEIAAQWIQDMFVQSQEINPENMQFALLIWRRCFQELSYWKSKLETIKRALNEKKEDPSSLNWIQNTEKSVSSCSSSQHSSCCDTTVDSGYQSTTVLDDTFNEIFNILQSLYKVMHEVIVEQVLQVQIQYSSVDQESIENATTTTMIENTPNTTGIIIREEPLQKRIMDHVLSTYFSFEQFLAFVESVCCPIMTWGQICELIMKWATSDDTRSVLYLGGLLLKVEKAFDKCRQKGGKVPPPPPLSKIKPSPPLCPPRLVPKSSLTPPSQRSVPLLSQIAAGQSLR
ncbi:hypothetical protein FDP41_005916 [Naegleria fowleri]|uniref:Uncharacterized protein n=1 Tax=Naegleria fowleri TaxID=5763 RepID=A0A6A5BB05_NAEFO|nr:uncharacterized protein FDP41_005916 [Naegleria fowleri]KAF0975163.1 hypothetical protein FDP41_005916 [Naegleria fowleri]